MTTTALSPDRDYAGDMRAVIDSEAVGTYNSREVADRIVAKLAATDPDLLNGWLFGHAGMLLRDAINRRDCGTRAHVRRSGARKVFADALDHAASEASVTPIRTWLTTPFVIDGIRTPLGELTGAEVASVADVYAETKKSAAMHEAFLRAVAKKAGPRGLVSDKFTAEQLDALWSRLSGA